MRLFALTALAISPIIAQPYPDAATLTKQAAAAILKLHSLQYKEDVTMSTSLAGQDMKINTETTRAMLNPGKTRFETHAQGLTMIVVSDGETTWTYSSTGHEYTRKSAGMGPQGIIEAMGMADKIPNMADIHMAQKTTGEETITIDGQKHECWVVETDIGHMDLPAAQGAKVEGGKMTSWIDKKLGIDLQSDTTMKVGMPGGMSSETHIHNVKKELQIDGPVADALFSFTPPEGAKEVEKLSLFGGVGSTPDMAGQIAPDFTLKTLDGKSYSLSALKGKPVLLDFWASWCGPCKKSMPAVEKVLQDYKGQGLTVLGVNADEERDTVADVAKRNPVAYPVVLSGESTVLKDYRVTSLPTFVLIGSDGKIAAYETGFGGDQALRAMLEKAGLTRK